MSENERKITVNDKDYNYDYNYLSSAYGGLSNGGPPPLWPTVVRCNNNICDDVDICEEALHWNVISSGIISN